MDVFEAIFTRQSIKKVLPDPLPHETIERLLAAAAQAPNHHKVRPWRFVVISGAGRDRLGAVLADSLAAQHPDLPPEALEKEHAKALRAPVLIAVGVDKPDDPRVVEIENVCAAAAATQNLLLAAHALGLGAIWRTGAAATDPAVKELLGLAADQHLIGMVYIGYPDGDWPPPQRASFEDRTTWLE